MLKRVHTSLSQKVLSLVFILEKIGMTEQTGKNKMFMLRCFKRKNGEQHTYVSLIKMVSCVYKLWKTAIGIA